MPQEDYGNQIFVDRFPHPANTVHSACCINFSVFPSLYEDTFESNGIPKPADIVMINNIINFIQSNKKFTAKLINKVTCFKDEEGYIRKENS